MPTVQKTDPKRRREGFDKLQRSIAADAMELMNKPSGLPQYSPVIRM